MVLPTHQNQSDRLAVAITHLLQIEFLYPQYIYRCLEHFQR